MTPYERWWRFLNFVVIFVLGVVLVLSLRVVLR